MKGKALTFPTMIRTKITISFVYRLTKKFASSLRRKRFQNIHRKGRPQFYSDALFLTMLLVRQIYGYSYRETLQAIKNELKLKSLPALSTSHYRLKKMPTSLIIEFHKFFVKWILSKLPNQIDFIIADGTGFSYNDLYPMKFHRGEEVRHIRSHVKVCAIIGVLKRGGKRILLGLKDGGAYASEARMVMDALLQLEQILGVQATDIPFVADKGYDSIRVIERVMEMGLVPEIKVRESWRHEVRNELREISKSNVESKDSKYKNRYLVESFFGTVKSKLGSHIYAKREDIARKEALARVIVWNIYVMVDILYFLRFLLKNYFMISLRDGFEGIWRCNQWG